MAQVQKMQKKTSTMSLTISSSTSSSVSSSREISFSSASSSGLLAQRHSSLVQPLCVSPQRIQSPVNNQQFSGKGVAPTFVKCLHDVSSVKGQLVVLECRLRGTPPLQVMWYREENQIIDSDDFRILRKKASSASVPEELCTLVITEAFPEDSGLFKCVALNSFGSVSCSALLEIYNDLEEQVEVEAMRQQEFTSQRQEEVKEIQMETSSLKQNSENFSPELPNLMSLPPPEWPDVTLEDNSASTELPPPPDGQSKSAVARQFFEESYSHSVEGHSQSKRSQEAIQVLTPSPPLPLPPPSPPSPAQVKEREKAPKLFSPSKLSFTTSQSGGNSMNLSDLPTFTPSAFPPSGFNYERPRHFIQSQPAFQAPSYESVLRDAQENTNDPQQSPGETEGPPRAAQNHSFSSKQSVSQSHLQTQSQFQSLSLNQSQSLSQSQTQAQTLSESQLQAQTNGTSKSSPSSSGLSSPTSTPASSAALPLYTSSSPTPVSSSTVPRTTVRSTITLTPRVPSATGLGSATLPANQDALSASAAYLCSVLPSPNAFSSKLSPSSAFPHPSISPSRSPLSPSSPLLPLRTLSSTSALPQFSPLSPTSSSSLQPHNTPTSQNRVTPSVVSLPANYKGTPNSIPKPILKKSVAPRPSSSRSTDEDIQGSKDALIQDLEKKLRSKEAKRRHSQKLSYEERMARRLLGPENATYMFDQDNLSDSQFDQPDSPEERHTGGLWGRRHTGTDKRSNEAIQEKCYAPRFLQTPPDLTVEEGRFCRIDFKVGGLPTPDVSWYLDGKAIRPDDYHKMLVCEKGMHSFIIEIVTVHHAGLYECVAKNRAGESRFSMKLNVLAQELLRPPTFVQKMQNTRALEGDAVRLECKVDASPPPRLYWKKDKDMLRIDPNRMSLYQDGSGRQCLLIERALKTDAGWYTLSAINEAGMSTCNARLDVGTRTTPPVKAAPPGSKSLKLLSSMTVPALTVESPPQHTAPLYESEEL